MLIHFLRQGYRGVVLLIVSVIVWVMAPSGCSVRSARSTAKGLRILLPGLNSPWLPQRSHVRSGMLKE